MGWTGKRWYSGHQGRPRGCQIRCSPHVRQRLEAPKVAMRRRRQCSPSEKLISDVLEGDFGCPFRHSKDNYWPIFGPPEGLKGQLSVFDAPFSAPGRAANLRIEPSCKTRFCFGVGGSGRQPISYAAECSPSAGLGQCTPKYSPHGPSCARRHI